MPPQVIEIRGANPTEGLSNCTRLWMKESMEKHFGPVLNVKKPPTSGDPEKDVAFVHFAKESDAEACVAELRKGMCLSNGCEIKGDYKKSAGKGAGARNWQEDVFDSRALFKPKARRSRSRSSSSSRRSRSRGRGPPPRRRSNSRKGGGKGRRGDSRGPPRRSDSRDKGGPPPRRRSDSRGKGKGRSPPRHSDSRRPPPRRSDSRGRGGPPRRGDSRGPPPRRRSDSRGKSNGRGQRPSPPPRRRSDSRGKGDRKCSRDSPPPRRKSESPAKPKKGDDGKGDGGQRERSRSRDGGRDGQLASEKPVVAPSEGKSTPPRTYH